VLSDLCVLLLNSLKAKTQLLCFRVWIFPRSELHGARQL
jgi:hypothetical protein